MTRPLEEVAALLAFHALLVAVDTNPLRASILVADADAQGETPTENLVRMAWQLGAAFTERAGKETK